jgi:uncharacterized membrane protein YphA (DoxX/SURF4 family)
MEADKKVNNTHKETGLPLLNRIASSNLGSRVYGPGAIALGPVGLVWGEFATVWQPVQASVPHREALAYIAAICLLSAGVAIEWRRTDRAGLLILTLLYFIFALLWLARVIRYPQIFATWGGFLEEMALVAAAVVIYATLAPHDSARAVRTAQIGRLLFAICVLSFGLSHFFALSETAGMVPRWIPPGRQFWAVTTGIAHLLAGVAILSGVLDVLASGSLTLMLVTFGALVWAPSLFAPPRTYGMVWQRDQPGFNWRSLGSRRLNSESPKAGPRSARPQGRSCVTSLPASSCIGNGNPVDHMYTCRRITNTICALELGARVG